MSPDAIKIQASAMSTLPSRREQRAQTGEAVGGDQPYAHQLGQRALHDARQLTALYDKIVEERGTAFFQQRSDQLRRRGDPAGTHESAQAGSRDPNGDGAVGTHGGAGI